MKRAFQRAITPLAFYYAVALAFPLVNGAGGPAFREHAIIVLAVPPAIVSLCGMVRALAVLSFRGAMGMAQGRTGVVRFPDGRFRPITRSPGRRDRSGLCTSG